MWVMFPNYRFVDQSNQRTVFISKGSYLAAGFLGPAYLLFKSGPRKLLQSLAWSIGCAVSKQDSFANALSIEVAVATFGR